MDNKREELIKLLQQNNIYNYTLTQHIIDLFKNKEKKIHKVCENRCLALTNNGIQCTRQQKYNNYCGIHQNKSNYIQYKNQENDYIETWVDEDLGPEYLIDSNNYVYTYSTSSPIIVGIKNKDGTIKPFNISPLKI